MDEKAIRDVRIIFTKTGVLKYISHLDLIRCFSTAIRRSELPIWYTEGYNPRPYLDFPRPLPLGVEGKGEILDMRFSVGVSNSEIKERLSKFLPEGFDIVDVVDPYLKSKRIDCASYTVEFDVSDMTEEQLKGAVLSGELKCEKRGKQGGRKVIKTVDISESINPDDVLISSNGDKTVMKIKLPCSNEKNINLLNVVTAVNNYLGTSAVPTYAVRDEIFDDEGNIFK